MPRNVITLAESLQAAGYQTVGITANPMTNKKYGFARGFEHYDDYSAVLAAETVTGNSSKTHTTLLLNRMAEDWLATKRDPARPLFLFLLYMDVHWDYFPPPPYNSMFTDDPIPPPKETWKFGNKTVPEVMQKRIVSAYDGEIRYTDANLAGLLRRIETSPRGANTVITFCSDHGEAFWEHGTIAHGNNLHEEELRVPLIIRPQTKLKGAKPGAVVTGQVGLIDLAPTLLDLADVDIPPTWQGRSLRQFLGGGAVTERPIVLDTRYSGFMRGVRTSRYKIISREPFESPTEVYDLLADPRETNNLVSVGAPLPEEVTELIPLLKPQDLGNRE